MTPYERYKEVRSKEVENLSCIKREAGLLQIALSDLYLMDMKDFTDYKYGVMSERTREHNSYQNMLHNIAGKVADAVWGNRNYNKPLTPVDYTEGILYDDKKRRINSKQAATLDRIRKQYGVELVYKEESTDG